MAPGDISLGFDTPDNLPNSSAGISPCPAASAITIVIGITLSNPHHAQQHPQRSRIHGMAHQRVRPRGYYPLLRLDCDHSRGTQETRSAPPLLHMAAPPTRRNGYRRREKQVPP